MVMMKARTGKEGPAVWLCLRWSDEGVCGGLANLGVSGYVVAHIVPAEVVVAQAAREVGWVFGMEARIGR